MELEKLEVRFPGRTLIETSRLNLLPGHIYCLLGDSGTGKSTLFAEIFARQQVTTKLVSPPTSLAECMAEDDTSVLDSVLRCTIPEDALNPERDEHRRKQFATQCLQSLGFPTKPGLDTRKVKTLSQGWQQRLGLARALASQPELLLLDEPSEGVDMSGMVRMEEVIKENALQQDCITIIISHDAFLLQSVTTDVIYIDEESKQLKQFAGDYSHYVQREEQRMAAMESRVDAAQRKRAHAAKFIAKHQQQGGKSDNDANKQRQAKERKEKMDRHGFYRDDGRRYKMHSLQKLDVKYLRLPQQTPEEIKLGRKLNFKPLDLEQASGSVLVSMDGADIGYEDDKGSIVLHDVALSIAPTSRIALVGDNSSGKSTLMHALLGMKSIRVSNPPYVMQASSIAFVPQCEGDRLAQKFAQLSASDYLVKEIKAMRNEYEARQFLGGFGLSGALAICSLDQLSSGQRTRFALAVGCVNKPQLLILDEPTYALDMPAKRALGEWIRAFPGALLVSSHDRQFLREDAHFNELWVVSQGRLECSGNNAREEENTAFQQVFDEYLESLL